MPGAEDEINRARGVGGWATNENKAYDAILTKRWPFCMRHGRGGALHRSAFQESATRRAFCLNDDVSGVVEHAVPLKFPLSSKGDVTWTKGITASEVTTSPGLDG
jgi:hypothetical protein